MCLFIRCCNYDITGVVHYYSLICSHVANWLLLGNRHSVDTNMILCLRTFLQPYMLTCSKLVFSRKTGTVLIQIWYYCLCTWAQPHMLTFRKLVTSRKPTQCWYKINADAVVWMLELRTSRSLKHSIRKWSEWFPFVLKTTSNGSKVLLHPQRRLVRQRRVI